MLLLQVVGVSGRRPERTAGVLLVMTPLKTEMMVKERENPETASENVVQSGGLNRPTPKVCLFIFCNKSRGYHSDLFSK